MSELTFRQLVEILTKEYGERMAQGLPPGGGPLEAKLREIVTAPPKRSWPTVARIALLLLATLATAIVGFGAGILVWRVVIELWAA